MTTQERKDRIFQATTVAACLAIGAALVALALIRGLMTGR